jgi:alkylation response protein AidB-like acyl-CoA dehydrogenase
MNPILDNIQIALRQETIEFAQTTLNDNVEQRDRTESFDRRLWEQCGRLALQGLAIPKEYGGRGLQPMNMVVTLEALGYGCRDNGLSFAIGAHLLACVIPIWKYGSTEQKEKYLPKLCNGTWVATNAITESETGSDVFSMSTSAVIDDHTFIIEGEKNYCSNAPVADIALLYAVTNRDKGALGGISGFILEKESFESTGKIEKMGLRSCHMGNIVCSSSKVTDKALLGKQGGGTIQFTQSMMWERIGLSAIHVGTMQRLLDNAVQYCKKRKLKGQSILKFQSIEHKLVDIKVQLEAARLLVYKAAYLLENNKKASNSASIAKLFVSEMYKKQTMNILQIYGAIGYVNNSDIERTIRDAASSTLYSGTSEVQKNLISRDL